MTDAAILREGFDVVRSDQSSDSTLRNLFEFYLHDLAEWFKFDQLPDGRYTESTERYWQDGHHVYLLHADGIPVGFALIGPADESLPGSSGMDMNEFFLVRRHRRGGVAKAFARHVWQLHPGPWLIRVYRANEPALPFWRKVISQHTAGNYVEETREKNGNPWSYFSFDTSDGSEQTHRF